MSEPFSLCTEDELLGFDNQQFQDSIRLEAIERGIKVPITLPDALRKAEWRGYSKPPEAVTVYELVAGYSSGGVAYLSQDLAERALEGALRVDQSGYNPVKYRLTSDGIEIKVRHVSTSEGVSKVAKFEEFVNEKEPEFDKLVAECLETFSEIRQRRYDAKVRQHKRAEYLRLAGGNEGIAKAFWSKTEGTGWPELEPNARDVAAIDRAKKPEAPVTNPDPAS